MPNPIVPGIYCNGKNRKRNIQRPATSILDSSIEITGKRFNEKKIVAVSSIQMIKIKRPFIKNVSLDFLVGAVLGGATCSILLCKKRFSYSG